MRPTVCSERRFGFEVQKRAKITQKDWAVVMPGQVALRITPGEANEEVALLKDCSTTGPTAECSAAVHPDVEQALELLHEATRVVTSLGTCVDGNGAYLAEALNVTKPHSDGCTSHISRQEVEVAALQELQQLAEADLADLEKRVTEAEATVRNLKSKIVLNSQTIDRLVAYRLLG
ncbi:hypothetical protein, conserved [Eimeria praecox]|uniref:Uncharacterized protein n=1 Tax=Eimeria praecox TaxID=51316 RepID=U6GMY6_9EIME|nr:hypothetical protein, conserved [Eimeria praecox]